MAVRKWAASPQGAADLAELRVSGPFRRLLEALSADAKATTRSAIAPGVVANGREFTAGYAAAATDLVEEFTKQNPPGV